MVIFATVLGSDHFLPRNVANRVCQTHLFGELGMMNIFVVILNIFQLGVKRNFVHLLHIEREKIFRVSFVVKATDSFFRSLKEIIGCLKICFQMHLILQIPRIVLERWRQIRVRILFVNLITWRFQKSPRGTIDRICVVFGQIGDQFGAMSLRLVLQIWKGQLIDVIFNGKTIGRGLCLLRLLKES